jgi:pyridinium-3,5-bisthiocarboxylic acid mononucleotide nickel chelatase
MRIAYFDCFSGISGDMVLGALLDLGVPSEVLFEELRKIPVTGYSLRAVKEERGLIGGTRVIIEVEEQPHRSLGDIRELIYQSKLNEGVQGKILGIFERLALAESRVHHMPFRKYIFTKLERLIPFSTSPAPSSGWSTWRSTGCCRHRCPLVEAS